MKSLLLITLTALFLSATVAPAKADGGASHCSPAAALANLCKP